MPVIAPPTPPVGSGPTFLRAAGRFIAKFGNAALPNGAGVLTYINLNDGVSVINITQDLSGGRGGFSSDDSNRQIGLSQLLFRGRSAYISDDFGPRVITLPMLYMEDANHFVGNFLASLSQAGEQQLTFDNATYILCKYQGISGRMGYRANLPLAWEYTLSLIAKSPWFQDATATTMAPLTLTVDAGQNFSITYGGSVYAEPVWTLTVPSGNTVPINQLQILNTMSGDTLTVNFLSIAPLPASTARTVTIDSSAMTATDNVGNSYDTYGTFPRLFPPVSTANPFTVIVAPASGSSSGLTLAASFNARWQI